MAAYAGWKSNVDAELKGASFDKKLITRTFEGVPIQPLYSRLDTRALSDAQHLPGQAPFVRGLRAGGYQDRPWEVAQEISATTPETFNAALVAELMRGQNSVVLSPAFTEGPSARNSSLAGGGVSILRLRDLRSALAGVELGVLPVHIDGGADAVPIAALHLALARERGTKWAQLTGSIVADPLGQWLQVGRLSCGIEELYDPLAEWTKWAAKNAPEIRTIGVNARIWADAGGHAVQELAFALAAAVEYLRALQKRAVPVETASARVRFEFAIGPQFFTEIAKFRAWRGLWTRVLSAFGVDPVAATRAAVHASTARWNKTALDMHVNMLRVTTEALSAVLGGCDSLQIAPYDEVTGATDDFSRRISRNVHALLAEEFGFAQTTDPAGGSWYVEKLTDDLARKAWELFQTVERSGGFVAAARAGELQQQVADTCAEKADAIGKRRLVLVGTNLFPNLKEKPAQEGVGTRTTSPSIAQENSTCAADLPPHAKWCDRFAAMIAAAQAGADVAALRLERQSRPPDETIATVKPWRASAGFEHLRAASDAFARRTGKRPRVFLAKMGPIIQHKARADFAAGFFAPGGFEIVAKENFDSADTAAKAAAESGAGVAVLCSTDDTYAALAPAFASAAKSARDDLILVLAGLPTEPAVLADYRAAGIDEFIHVRANVQDVLAKLLLQIGALV